MDTSEDTTPRLEGPELDYFEELPGCTVAPTARAVRRAPAPLPAEFAALHDVARRASLVYVGGTVDPVRRWLGCHDTGMRGHQQRWSGMVLVAARSGRAGPEVEAALIREAIAVHGRSRVANIAIDARGLVSQRSAVNYLYICFLS